MPTIRFFTLLLIAGLAACSGAPTTPDLKRLYAQQAGNLKQPPVILVHGLMGARLARTSDGNEVWPGSVRRILFDDYQSLRLDIDPETLLPKPSDLSVTGVTDKAAGRDFYGRILSTLEQAGGFAYAEPGQAVEEGKRHYYVFAYDWRQDNVASVRQLDALIRQIKEDHGNPALKVDIVAHSMGGLITRYYVRYGTVDVLNDNDFPVNNAGAANIRRVLLLGTPNFGSVAALRALIRGFKIGFGTIPTEVVATFPSSPQLLPHALNDWLVTANGKRLKRDLFSVRFWERFEFGVYSPEVAERVINSFDDRVAGERYLTLLRDYFGKHLERARRFTWSLTVEVDEPQLNFIAFGGDCHLTPARALVEEQEGESILRLFPHEVRTPLPGVDYDALLLEPGDGTVTKASLLARRVLDPSIARHRYSFFPLKFAFFLCERHDALTGNLSFQDNLLHALLSVDEY